MNLCQSNLTIRNARPADAAQLCTWWNDGAVMAHAGFPNGLGTTEEKVRQQIEANTDETMRLHIIEHDNIPIGEMNYRNKGDGVAEIGIKICDTAHQEKGLGTRLLAMFIDELFTHHGYEKIILDANAANPRAWHVYENKLGFTRVGFRENAWTDQLGNLQSAIDYEMTAADWQRNPQKPSAYVHLG